ncbi:MAG: S41 family peptidase [Bryobacteraceae bacterium]
MRFCRRWLPAAILPLFLTSFGSLVRAAGPQTSDNDIRQSLREFSKVYGLVESNFATKVDSDRAIFKGAIPAMLRTLDPHSNFFDPQAYELLREDQAGHYSGVGMMVGAPEGHVVVMYPFEGSPAFKAGVHPGDSIIAVNDKNTTKMDVAGVSNLLKGPRDTKVQMEVRRAGGDKPLYFDMTRGQVPRSSVPQAFWLKPGIAYLKIDGFNENTSHEVDAALKKLNESQITGLVLDLRDNPGGILQEAVAVADRFLQKGQVIVSHHGRASAETKFFAQRGERGPMYPIVALVNRGSASAAEILAGALQDHDRAWILGENTFGKGLVQAPYPLSGDSALLLTIAHYYTPSGRLIQRDYAHESFYEYYTRQTGKNNMQDARRTDSGRVVYGGDGITPDEKYATPELSELEETLAGNLTFFFYGPHFFEQHPAKLAQNWKPDAAALADFEKFASSRGVQFSQDEWKKDDPWIADRLREELFVTAFSKEESDKIALLGDPEVWQGVRALPQSRALLERAKAIIAQRELHAAQLSQ